MIKCKDVVTLRVPFPGINSGLAVKPHMYICKSNVHNSDYELVKCQSFKPRLLALNHKVIEDANRKRNPFSHKSVIDCDQLFSCHGICIPDSLLTTIRRDVCQDLYDTVLSELNADGLAIHQLSSDELAQINNSL